MKCPYCKKEVDFFDGYLFKKSFLERVELKDE